jgi:hypothetical protein
VSVAAFRGDSACVRLTWLNGVGASLHGSQAALHDALSGRPGAFDESLRGLANLRRDYADVSG